MKYPIDAEKALTSHELHTGLLLSDAARQVLAIMIESENNAWRQGFRDGQAAAKGGAPT